MSEQINKVLASTAQSFATAEQKQARDNIGAMAASASSLFYSTSNPSAFISGVDHDSNLSGSGTDASPLGLNTSITLAKNGESATLAYDHLTLANSDNDPIISAANGDIYMSAHAGNASSPYTANYGVQGMNVYGTDTYNHITATATLRYSGATFVEGNDSAKIKATGLTLHTTADGDQLIDASSVVRWNSYSSMSSFTGCSANNCISGDGTSGSPLGLSSKVRLENSYSALELQPNYILVNNHVGSAQIGNSYVRLTYPLNGGTTAHMNNSALTFIDSANNQEQVDGSSINRWNSYSAGTWNESGNSLSTGFGGNKVDSASQYNDGAGNWACRTVKMSGTPDQNLYGFQSKPNGTGTAYMINPAGAFVQYQPTYFCKLYHRTGAVYEDLGTSFYPTGLTADARLDFINLCSGCSANIMTDTFHGTTAILDPGMSATMWYIASADIWTDGNDDVPV